MGDFPIIILDFETTGLSPQRGDRAIEIGAVLIDQNRIVDRFHSLMNPGISVNPFIQGLTGITNAMVRSAPDGAGVMTEFLEFMGDYPLAAHNAPFDGRFLDAELARIGRTRTSEMVCTLRTARRIYPHLQSHNLESLVRYKNLQVNGAFHRAAADAEMTARLWLAMIEDIKKFYNVAGVSLDSLQKLSRIARAKAQKFFV
ncbi:MAG: 3'-5' exonuclease [Proteobacteria bacterium]|jgi:DNA polymerase-3 subunit epsilon|nr:3'-5' exonuclease [Desulfocapsa sp.]MBU3945530.1 3'-5' exonuclease [Pseudomonadota bacterium]MCG2745080.1 3'-5' exonuclease [Desulfobacteraceae bacterium]MBU4029241.1 3'-5' exonuclease [Pseudomonadota bacterium]MBU4043970.1 3'-5' exonuclease [Pseudomonadota bacterium]